MNKNKVLKVIVKQKKVISYIYDYEYTDVRGMRVIGEEMPSVEYIEKEIKKRINKLSNIDYKIILKKDN